MANKKNTAVKGYKINFANNTITVNYTFKKASEEYGTAEYEILKNILADFPTQSDGQRFLLPSLILRNLKRFTRIYTPHFFVRLVQDVFQSVRNGICFSLGSENEPREESS